MTSVVSQAHACHTLRACHSLQSSIIICLHTCLLFLLDIFCHHNWQLHITLSMTLCMLMVLESGVIEPGIPSTFWIKLRYFLLKSETTFFALYCVHLFNVLLCQLIFTCHTRHKNVTHVTHIYQVNIAHNHC